MENVQVNKKVDQYNQSIQNSLDTIIQTVEGLPEDTIRSKPSAEEWSIIEVLSHVAEATDFWLGELENVLEKPGSKWGRGLQHEGRLAAVANADALDINEVMEEVKSKKELVANELSKVSDERLTEENPHRNFEKFGNKPVSFLIEHFLVEHTENHANQIKRNLSKFNK